MLLYHDLIVSIMTFMSVAEMDVCRRVNKLFNEATHTTLSVINPKNVSIYVTTVGTVAITNTPGDITRYTGTHSMDYCIFRVNNTKYFIQSTSNKRCIDAMAAYVPLDQVPRFDLRKVRFNPSIGTIRLVDRRNDAFITVIDRIRACREYTDYYEKNYYTKVWHGDKEIDLHEVHDIDYTEAYLMYTNNRYLIYKDDFGATKADKYTCIYAPQRTGV